MSTTAEQPKIDGRGYLRLVGIGAAIGIPAALVAAVFLAIVHQSETWLWDDLPEHLGQDTPPWYLVVLLPVVGAAIVWIARRFLPGDGGHPPIEGISAAPTPWRHAPGIALAAFGTLAFGAVLGPEAPLIALGSVVGTAVAPMLKLDRQEERVIATAGSFSAVSALFGGPLVAGMLLLEAGIGTGSILIPVLLPGLVAAAVGYVLFIGIGDWGGIDQAGLVVGGLPTYTGTHLLDLLLAIVVGVVASVAIAPVHAAARRVMALAKGNSPRRMLTLLLAGGLAVGLCAQAAQLLGADSQEILFSGQASVPELVDQTTVKVLLVVLVAKAIGYAISLGCGFRGGPVFPAIFLGVTIAAFAVAVFDTSPTWAVAVGTAAGMTAGTGLIFSSLLFSMLLVGDSGVDALPAAVLAAAAAWLTRAFLERSTLKTPAGETV